MFSICLLPVSLVCQVIQQLCSQLLLFPVSLFLALLVLTLACPDSEPACLTTLPTLTLSLPAVRYRCPTSGLLTPASLDLSIACPCWIIKSLLIRRCLHLGLTFIPGSSLYLWNGQVCVRHGQSLGCVHWALGKIKSSETCRDHLYLSNSKHSLSLQNFVKCYPLSALMNITQALSWKL